MQLINSIITFKYPLKSRYLACPRRVALVINSFKVSQMMITKCLMRVLPWTIHTKMKFKKFLTSNIKAESNNSSWLDSIRELIVSISRWICSLHLTINLQMMYKLIFQWNFQILHLRKTSMNWRPSVRLLVKALFYHLLTLTPEM